MATKIVKPAADPKDPKAPKDPKDKNPRKTAADTDKLLAKVPAGAKKPSKVDAQKALDECEVVKGEGFDAVLSRRGLKAR